jgi:hypothetical protein
MQAPVVERIAGWSARHRKTAVLGWLVLVAAVFVGGQMLPASNVPSYDVGQSGQGEQVLHRLNVISPPAESVLIQARDPGRTIASDPQLRQATRQIAAVLRARPGTAHGVRSPFGPGGKALISADGRSALVTFTILGNPDHMDQTVAGDLHAVAAVQARHPGLLIQEAGDASGDRAITKLVDADFRKAETTSVPITLILLLIVFGALIAASIPLLLAGTSVITAISLLAIPGHWFPTGSNASEVVLLIGRAVGIDYCLFYLRREREARARGRHGRRGGADRRRHLGPRDRDLGPDRDDRARWLVPDRGRGVHRHGDRRDHRGGRGGDRVADLPARAAVLAGPVGPTGAGSRSSAAGAPRPSRPGCGPRWSAGWSGVPCCGAVRPGWPCSRSPRPRWACTWAPPPTTSRTTSRSWLPTTGSSTRSRRPRPRPRWW